MASPRSARADDATNVLQFVGPKDSGTYAAGATSSTPHAASIRSWPRVPREQLAHAYTLAPPRLSEAVPLGHATHALNEVARVKFEYVPAGQSAHPSREVLPGVARYVPAGHSLHCEALGTPSAELKVPGGHAPHEAL